MNPLKRASIGSNHVDAYDFQDEGDLGIPLNVSSPTLFNTNVKLVNSNPPYTGQIFTSYEETKEFYYMYASRVGFLVKKGTTKVVYGILFVRHFICSKARFLKQNLHRKSNRLKLPRISRELRCGCPTYICINRINDSDKWVVGSLIAKHNHLIVTPSKRRCLRTNQLYYPISIKGIV